MRKYLALAGVLAAGCNDSNQVSQAERVTPTSELQAVRIDIRSGLLHLTFESADGETTVVLTPEAATQAHRDLGQMLAQRLQTVEAPRAP